MMMQITIPVEAGNNAARAGVLGETIRQILEPLKPESAYFVAMPSGERGGFVVFDLQDTSQIPAIAEPFFLAFNAKLCFYPVMTPQDLAAAKPGIDKAVKQFGQAAKLAA
jgi:hypothetical protein